MSARHVHRGDPSDEKPQAGDRCRQQRDACADIAEQFEVTAHDLATFGGGPPGAHFSRYWKRKACDESAPIGISRAAQVASCRSMSASYSTWQPNGLLKYQNQLLPNLWRPGPQNDS